MTGICANSLVTADELHAVKRIFASFGRAEVVSESMMDAVVSVSGSAPAYVFLFLEALADAAVADGMPRKMAYEFAAQAVYGSAKMMLETGMHPGNSKIWSVHRAGPRSRRSVCWRKKVSAAAS